MTVQIDNGPLWIQVAIALGTIGAALAAASAALVALKSARASQHSAAASADLVALERERSVAEREERLSANPVLSIERSYSATGAAQMWLVVTNPGPHPAFDFDLRRVDGVGLSDGVPRLVDWEPVPALVAGAHVAVLALAAWNAPHRLDFAVTWTDGTGEHEELQHVVFAGPAKS